MILTVAGENVPERVSARLTALLAGHAVVVASVAGPAGEDPRVAEVVLDVSRCPDPAALRRDLFAAAAELEFDVALVDEETHRRRKRVVLFDMDSTLVDGEGVDMLAARAGVADAVAAMTREAMEGGLDFATSLRRRVALLAGFPEATLLEIAATVPLTPGAAEVVAALRRLGYRVGLVTGGFAPFADALQRRLGLDVVFANRLEIRDGALTGRVFDPILDAAGKAARLREVAAREGVSTAEVVAVGDGANDVPMLEAAGLGVAFLAKEITRRSADAAIQRRHLGGLLDLLGVSAEERRRIQGG